MTAAPLRAARVHVPCSTSNLGAGFDCLGLALDRYLYAEYFPAQNDRELRVERPAGSAVLQGRDLVRDLFVSRLNQLGHAAPAGKLVIQSEIPTGRGLGSSAAATVAGLLLAHGAAGEARPDRMQLLPVAEASEGHADNAAPALLGGLIAVARNAQGMAQAFRLPLSEAIGFVIAAPDVEVSTPEARAALPAQVAHAQAARAIGRTAALLQGLAHADEQLLRIGFSDELHVPYRLPLIPRAEQALAAAREAGAWAATISGSGSGLLAVCTRGAEHAVARAMAEALHDDSRGAPSAFGVRPDLTGATLEIEV